MSAQVIPLHVTMAQVEAAWAEYDAAVAALHGLYRGDSTARERFNAAMHAQRLHRRFVRLFDRLPPCERE